jgi:hypothetical protein
MKSIGVRTGGGAKLTFDASCCAAARSRITMRRRCKLTMRPPPSAARFAATLPSCWGPEAPSKIQEVTLMRPFHGNL